MTLAIRGRQVTASTSMLVCPVCGEQQPDHTHATDTMEPFYTAYREQSGMMQPHQVRAMREQYGLSQQALAKLLGMSPATLSRYESGSLQEETHDHLLRMCSNPANMLEIFRLHGAELSELQQRRFREAIANCPQLTTAMVWSEQCSLPAEFTGSRPFSYFRYAFMVKAILQVHGETFVTKLNKLLFYADFLAFRCLGQSISGSPYRAIQHGPVPADYGGLHDRLLRDSLVRSEEVNLGEFSGERLVDGTPLPFDGEPLSQDEMSVVQFVASTLKPLSAREISDRSHNEAAWAMTSQRSLISYVHAAALSLRPPGR